MFPTVHIHPEEYHITLPGKRLLKHILHADNISLHEMCGPLGKEQCYFACCKKTTGSSETVSGNAFLPVNCTNDDGFEL
jgi:hypothetical protein